MHAELVRALAGRSYAPATPHIWAAAAGANEDAAVVALAALGRLAEPARRDALLRLLLNARSERVREAATGAFVAVSRKIDDVDRRIAPVVDALPQATGAGRVALIRILGRCRCAAGIAALRGAVEDTDSDVVDAAVRALSDWPDAEALDDLEALAGHAERTAHRVLALRGYVRLIGASGELSPADALGRLRRVLPAAFRPEDKRLVIGALGKVAHRDAVALAQSFLADADYRSEAAAAMLGSARLLVGSDPDAARAAIAAVRAADLGPRFAELADDAESVLERAAGYCTDWLITGPYFDDTLSAEELLQKPFGPELSGKEPKWSALPIDNDETPWVFDLQTAVGGDKRCVYVVTEIWSEAGGPARLEIGSDDGVRAWVNDELVHDHFASRSHVAGEDKAPITLKAGWNPLMLKVVNISGGWAFSCAVRDPDGGSATGLRLRRPGAE